MKTRQLFSLVSTLSGVTRFSMLKAVHTETVLEHTGMMACFAYTLGTLINAAGNYQLDMGKLMSKATVHDWDESATGDVARPTKYFSKTLRSEMACMEYAAVERIEQDLGLRGLRQMHGEAKEGAEGSIVKLCDIACAIHRCWEEVQVFGNLHFTLPAQRLRKVLHATMKGLELGGMNAGQWNVIDTFALELNNIVNDVVRKANNELQEMASAD